MTDIATLSGNERDPAKIAFVVRQLAERAASALPFTDGDKGDITVSASGTIFAIDPNAVTNTQLADMEQDIIKGRASGAGTGDPTDLTHTQVHDILRGLFGRERFLSLASTPVTLVATDAGKFILNYNANRTITLPTVASGLCLGFYTLDGGSGGNLTINFGGALLFPDGSIVNTSIVLTSDQRMLIVSDGTNWIVFASNFRTGLREKLTAARTYYVRTDGSDSNDGLTNTAGGAFLTLQKALDVVGSSIDFAGFTVTIQLADGTYTAISTVRRCVGQLAAANLVIAGNNATPANVVLTQAVSFGQTIWVPQDTACLVKDLKLVATNGYCFFIQGGDLAFQNVDFGAAGQAHIYSEIGFATATGNYTISGDALYHWLIIGSGYIKVQSITVTASGTRAFTTFVHTQNGQITSNGCTFTGTYTGKRYDAILNGVIQTFGSGANYFPGNAAGTTATGGQYA